MALGRHNSAFVRARRSCGDFRYLDQSGWIRNDVVSPMNSNLAQRLIDIPDPVQRNYAITAQYHSLGVDLADRLGKRDANWLIFGAWASHSAGKFIRGDLVPVSWGQSAVAQGNLAIICDIGPRFARFLELSDEVPTADVGGAVAQEQLLTESPALAEAFACYADAILLASASDDAALRRRAQLILRANILIAHHEQDFADPLVDAAIPLGGVAGILGTRFVKITTPDGDLDVCRDVPRPGYLNGGQWPAPLDDLSDDRLVALVRGYGQTPNTTRYSNATSWESLHERMGYITCFFRAYQQDPALFQLPAEG